jgi:DNA-binding response OmpR family regulator
MERTYRILLLEDEPLLRGMLAMALGRMGYRVATGGSLEEAEQLLHLLGWQWADAVICDAHLNRDPRRLHGHLFHARWRARHPVPPFLFLCGEWEEYPRPYGEDCVVCRLHKPFAPSELFQVLEVILAR